MTEAENRAKSMSLTHGLNFAVFEKSGNYEVHPEIFEKELKLEGYNKC